MKTLKIKLMNVIYLIISAFAAAWLVITPFVTVGIQGEITKESGLITEEMCADMGTSLDDLFAEGGIPIDVAVEINNQMLIDVWKAEDAEAYVKNDVIQVNVDKIVENLEEPLNKVVKSAAKGMITDIVEDELKKKLGENQDLYTELAKSNLSQEDVAESVGKVVDKLTEEGATFTAVSETLTTEYNKYLVALDPEATPKTVEEMKSEMQESLQEFGLLAEDGETINDISDVIGDLIASLLGGGSGETSEPSSAVAYKLLKPFGEEASEENDLAKVLCDIINEKIEPFIDYIVLGVKGASIAVAAFILGWALKVLRVLIKFFAKKKPYINGGPIFFITGFVQLILAIVCGLVALLSSGLLETLPFYAFIQPYISFIPAGLKINLEFSAMITGLVVVFNIIYSFFYGIAKRRFKREMKKAQ